MPIQLLLPGLTPAAPPPPAPPSDDLMMYPEVPSGTLSRHAKLLGRAGEALVDSFLGRWGLLSLPVPECQPFDRLLVIGGTALRAQIKTASVARDGHFNFEVSHGYRGSPTGVRGYAAGSFDLLILVMLPHNAVMFSADLGRRHRIAVTDIPRLQAAPRASLGRALVDLGLDAATCPGGEPDAA